ncbi:MAG TPA: polysaccharide deacetylase family protein [Tepidisphaeraceae bacterium]
MLEAWQVAGMAGRSLGICAALGVSVGMYGMFAPRSNLWGKVYYRGAADSAPRVALTFDDGPCPATTPAVLDALGELGAKGTFFVIGSQALAHPEIVARIAAEGHIVANHSFDHAYYGTMRRWRYWRPQIRRTADAIEQIIGRRSAMFRPPMGFKTPHVIRSARAEGHAVITWSRRAFDSVIGSRSWILGRLGSRTQAGEIVALHDGSDWRRERRKMGIIAEVVKPLVMQLRGRGLAIAPLDELLKLPAYAGGQALVENAANHRFAGAGS